MTSPSPLSSRPNVALLAAALAFTTALFAPGADAQTTIRLTTTAGQSCVAVTDASGLTLVPGGTDLQATGVTLTGAGCGGGGSGGNDPPTSTNGLLLTASPSAPIVGQTTSISWNVSNATSCAGTVTTGVAANVSGWNSVSSPTAPRTVTFSAAGAYGLVLTCSNTAGTGTLVSPVLLINVGTTATSCTTGPAGLTQLTSSDIKYPTSTALRRGVDVTVWDNIWGHASSTDGVTPWPGVIGSAPILMGFTKTNYLAAHFHTGAGGTLNGTYRVPYNVLLNNVDMSISTICGDFTQMPERCLVTNVGNNGAGLVVWQFTPNTGRCILEPNRDYFVNLKFTDPQATSPCSGQSCPMSVQSNYGGHQ